MTRSTSELLCQTQSISWISTVFSKISPPSNKIKLKSFENTIMRELQKRTALCLLEISNTFQGDQEKTSDLCISVNLKTLVMSHFEYVCATPEPTDPPKTCKRFKRQGIAVSLKIVSPNF